MNNRVKIIKYKNRNYLKLSILGIVLATFFWFGFFSKRFTLTIKETAKIEADNKIYEILYLIVNDCIKKVDKTKFLVFKKNQEKELILTEYNLDEIYNLLNLISEKIDLSKKEFVFFIPFGMASKKFLLNYWGPNIPVKTGLLRNMYINIKTKVTNYGINNALVEVYVVIQTHQRIISPFSNEDLVGNYEMLISSYFINGKVPNFYGDSLELSSNVFDI